MRVKVAPILLILPNSNKTHWYNCGTMKTRITISAYGTSHVNAGAARPSMGPGWFPARGTKKTRRDTIVVTLHRAPGCSRPPRGVPSFQVRVADDSVPSRPRVNSTEAQPPEQGFSSYGGMTPRAFRRST